MSAWDANFQTAKQLQKQVDDWKKAGGVSGATMLPKTLFDQPDKPYLYGEKGYTEVPRRNPDYDRYQAQLAAEKANQEAAIGLDPFFTTKNTKSNDVQDQIGKLFGLFDKAKQSATSAASGFSSAIQASQPRAQGYADQETSAVDRYYNGSMAGELAALREARQTAVNTATERAMGDLKRILSLERLGDSPGGSQAAGTGSYLQKLALDRASELRSQAALDDVNQQRTDLDALERLRMALTGQRNQIQDSTIQRQLLPSQMDAETFNRLVQQLAALQQSDLFNNFYGLGKRRDVQPGTYVTPLTTTV